MCQLSTRAMLLVAVFAGGCARDAPTAPAAASPPETAAVAAGSAVSCENVRGALAGNFAAPGGFALTGLGSASVTVVGIDAKGADEQGAIHSVTIHQIDTPRGTILTSDEGVLAPIDPPVYRLNHRWTITGGTGEFTGATGFLHPHARIDLVTGDIEGSFHGRICT